jgi:hypothetical protein
VQVFICSRDIVTWVFPAGGLFLSQRGQIQENENASMSDARFQRVKSYRTSRVAFYTPVQEC